MHAYIHACMHTYIHACMHAYMHACIHTYTGDMVSKLFCTGHARARAPTHTHTHTHTGDTMVFKLSADGSRVQEFLNGALEIDDVKYIEVDREVIHTYIHTHTHTHTHTNVS